MWGRKSPIEEYLDKHPDSTLREYNEYVKEEERKRHGRIWKTVYLHRLIPLSQFRA